MRLRWIFLSFLFVSSALVCFPVRAQEAMAPSAAVQNLTLADAQKIAIQNHPDIQAAQDVAEAASEHTRQIRSAYYPTAFGSLSGAEAESNSRVAAGALNNPIVFDRYSNGVQVNQLVTDFGRTHELVKSSSLQAKAQEEGIVTSRAHVLLSVDRSYYGALKAQAVMRVAQETVKDRQLSFANVDLAQAQLLLVQAQNDLQASYAALTEALGYADQRVFNLIETDTSSDAPPIDEATALQQAIRDRPELIGKRLEVSSAQSYVTAERDLWLPTITAVGVAGLTPVHQTELAPRYAAGGFNVNIPLFNGHLYGALRGEANAQARAQEQYLRAEQNGVVRDVQRAWLDANSGYQRLGLTNQLLEQASEALELAQARYKLGLSSIIELSQAQLNQTQAEIAQVSARYDYRAELAVLAFQSGQIR